MAGRVREGDLVIPALRIAEGRPDGHISTSDLIVALTEWFEPDGEDAEILDGRVDTKFSQKVRNLIPHRIGKKTMFTLGYAIYEREGITITEAGRNFLRSLADHE